MVFFHLGLVGPGNSTILSVFVKRMSMLYIVSVTKALNGMSPSVRTVRVPGCDHETTMAHLQIEFFFFHSIPLGHQGGTSVWG